MLNTTPKIINITNVKLMLNSLILENLPLLHFTLIKHFSNNESIMFPHAQLKIIHKKQLPSFKNLFPK